MTPRRHPDVLTTPGSRVPAAQYVRMSTEHQQYSTENQREAIAEYARARGYEIVQTYADDGKSGLRIEGRESLRRLIDDVQGGHAGFQAILVYDISRWGRFQDSDESAYYEHLASTLSVDIGAIRQKRDLLKGICPEAVALLKDKNVVAKGLRELRRVAPMRQIEMTELMIAANNFSTDYVRCLIAATPEKDLVDTEKMKVLPGMKPEDIARMEHEMEVLSRDFTLIEESHGKNTLNLVLAVGYLRKLLANAAVVRHLSQRFPDILGEFQKLIDTPELKGG